ncbi:hypothetical protein SASPL_151399 [Salvia splendens]|uniref:non-specific serine/threonine protein kinase n=2 Tax=Salvia splendens TaxID=180675 RepID=A0A8X8Z3K5_SALSN|nr:hypothetical protein SASPL_151399 [Salvia splendens]
MNTDNLHTFSFCILSLIIITSKICHGADYRYEACAPANCGNGPNISYPFFLPSQQRQQSYCGFPVFAVNCSSSGFPLLRLSENEYIIEDIFYHNQSIHVVDAAVQSSSNCTIYSSRNTTLPAGKLNYVGGEDFLLFSGCGNVTGELLRYQVACHSSATVTEAGGSRAPASTNTPSVTITNSSSTGITISSVTNSLAMYGGNGNLGRAVGTCVASVAVHAELNEDERGEEVVDVAAVLGRGFVMNWTAASDCSACQESGGRCGFDENSDRFRCFCRDRPHSTSCGPASTTVAWNGGHDALGRRPPQLWKGCDGRGMGRARGDARCGRDPRRGWGRGSGGWARITFRKGRTDQIRLSMFFAGETILNMLLYIGGPIAALTFCLIVAYVFIRRKRAKAKQAQEKDIKHFLEKNGNLAPIRYKYSTIKKITNSFNETLGKGGFGNVYKGKLPNSRLVAIKVLNDSNGNGEDFMNEVASISRTSHVNIVPLLGFCFEGSERALIYDFMPNGSLEKFIGNNASSSQESALGWDKLFEIALGIARGLEYLHQGCNTRILHLDIKPQNILLDEDMNPRISDFGLAKLCPNRSGIVSMKGTRGTIGYIAPEVFYRNFGEVSYKSDVYSYGMLVLEMAGGKKTIDRRDVDRTSETYFPNYIYKELEVNAERAMNEEAEAESQPLKRNMIIVGLWCIQTNPKDRPSMTRVVEMLEGKLGSLEVPPKPYLQPSPRAAPTYSTSESSSLLSTNLMQNYALIPRANPTRCGKTRLRKIVFIGGITIATLASSLVIVFVSIQRKRARAKQDRDRDIELFLKDNGNLVPMRYKYSSIKKMTNSFSENLGRGGFGSVYKGQFPDGCLVAVKVLNESNGNGEDFMNEVASISRTSHVNIVSLLGFCYEGSRRALIYNFMPNGSLEKFIGNNASSSLECTLGWDKLFEIALGIARGLEYLHQGCSTRILHLDIKPQNILLDKELCPKISDFGLAKLCPNRSSILSMLVARGTIGYIAPEVFSRSLGEVSYKSDVYSYGMLVLEMVGGRTTVDPRDVDRTSEIYFPNYLYKQMEVNNAERDVEDGNLPVKRNMIVIGLWCIQTNPKDRPSMTRVVEMLEGKLGSLEVPPKPYLYSPPRAPPSYSTSESF